MSREHVQLHRDGKHKKLQAALTLAIPLTPLSIYIVCLHSCWKDTRSRTIFISRVFKTLKLAAVSSICDIWTVVGFAWKFPRQSCSVRQRCGMINIRVDDEGETEPVHSLGTVRHETPLILVPFRLQKEWSPENYDTGADARWPARVGLCSFPNWM